MHRNVWLLIIKSWIVLIFFRVSLWRKIKLQIQYLCVSYSTGCQMKWVLLFFSPRWLICLQRAPFWICRKGLMFHESGHGGCRWNRVKGCGCSWFRRVWLWSVVPHLQPHPTLQAVNRSLIWLHSTPRHFSRELRPSVLCKINDLSECFRQPFLPSLPVRGCPDINVKNTQHIEPGYGSLSSPSPGNMNLIIGYFPSRPHRWDPHLSLSQCKPRRKAALWVQWELLGSDAAVSGGRIAAVLATSDVFGFPSQLLFTGLKAGSASAQSSGISRLRWWGWAPCSQAVNLRVRSHRRYQSYLES